ANCFYSLGRGIPMILNSTKSIFTTNVCRNAMRAVVVMMGMLLVCAPLFPQGSEGRIVGTVTDPSGGSVPGAKVTITDSERGVARTLTADSSGAYAAPSLIPGTYSLRVEFQGFRTIDRKDIVLQVGQEVRIDFTLQPGAQAETVTV